MPIVDPTNPAARLGVAQRCAAALKLSMPMAVDSMDDAASLAYNAWPERIYVIAADGTIAFKGALGPSGFKPRDAMAALATLLGEAPIRLPEADAAPGPECADDGFSGTWTGEGRGPVSGGQSMGIRFALALGEGGVVGGRFEVMGMRVTLADARYDAATGTLTAVVPMQGMRWRFAGTVAETSLTGAFTNPGGQTMFDVTVTRAAVGPPLQPGVADATGTWRGVTTAEDPALEGKPVALVLRAASPDAVAGSLTIDERAAEIRQGAYDAATGTFACSAIDADGGRWQVTATVRGRSLEGRAMRPEVALAIEFTLTLPAPTHSPGQGPGEDF